MSTDAGEVSAAKGFVDEMRDLVLAGEVEAGTQLDLLLDSEAMLEAREELGNDAAPLTVVRRAGEIMRKRGRPKGVQNRRTDDFRKYILSIGPNPLVVMAQIMAETEELVIARSAAVDSAKRRMTFGEARAMRIRCAEAVSPYVESKQPVAIDMGFSGLSDLIIAAGAVPGEAGVSDILQADFIDLGADDGGDA